MDSLRSEFNENMQKMLYSDAVWGVPSFRTERAYVTRDQLSVLRSEVQILGLDCDKLLNLPVQERAPLDAV